MTIIWGSGRPQCACVFCFLKASASPLAGARDKTVTPPAVENTQETLIHQLRQSITQASQDLMKLINKRKSDSAKKLKEEKDKQAEQTKQTQQVAADDEKKRLSKTRKMDPLRIGDIHIGTETRGRRGLAVDERSSPNAKPRRLSWQPACFCLGVVSGIDGQPLPSPVAPARCEDPREDRVLGDWFQRNECG